jgi:hypothetical protein
MLNQAVVRAVVLHIFTGTIPLIVFAICYSLSNRHTLLLLIEFMSLLTILKTLIMAIFFATRIPGIRETFGFKGAQVGAQSTAIKM